MFYQPDGLPDANLYTFKEWNSRSRAVEVSQESQPYLASTFVRP
jgi:hypothetical protein